MINSVNNSPALPITPASGSSDAAGRTTAGQLSFSQLIEQKLDADGLKFSAHAQARLQSRNITLSTEDMVRLKQGVAQAASKGSRESLVLKDNVAFVVSITNNTVITAVDAQSMQGNVFTNIDSAVIV